MRALAGTPRFNEKWRGHFAYLCRAKTPRAIASAGYELSAQLAARRISKIAGVVRVDWVGRGVKDCHPGLSDIDLRITLANADPRQLREQLSSLRRCLQRLKAEIPWLGEVSLVNLEVPSFLRELSHGVLWDKCHTRQLFPVRKEQEDLPPDCMTASRLGSAFAQYRLAALLFAEAFGPGGAKTFGGQRCRRLLEKALWILVGNEVATTFRNLSLAALLDVVIATFRNAVSDNLLLPRTSEGVSGRQLAAPLEIQIAHDNAKKVLRARVTDLEDSGVVGIFTTADQNAGMKVADLLPGSKYFPVIFVPHTLVPFLQNGWGNFSSRSFLYRTERGPRHDFSPSCAWVSLLHRLALWESVWWGRWVSESDEKLESIGEQASSVRTQVDGHFLSPEFFPPCEKNLTRFTLWENEYSKMRETLRRALSQKANLAG